MARRELPHHIQVCAVNIIAELYKAAKQGVTFGSSHRQNRFAGMAQKRQDNNTKGNYS